MPKRARTRKLTLLEEAFVQQYLIDLRPMEAVKRAGYRSKRNVVAAEMAYKILKRPVVAEAIQKAMDKRAERTQITADGVLRELGKLVYSDLRKYYNEDGTLKSIHELPDELAGAVAGFETVKTFVRDDEGKMVPEYTKKVKLWDKNSAIEKAMKHLKILSDQHELTGKDGASLVPPILNVTFVRGNDAN